MFLTFRGDTREIFCSANWSVILPNWGKSDNFMIMYVYDCMNIYYVEITDSYGYINVIPRVRYLAPDILKDSQKIL